MNRLLRRQRCSLVPGAQVEIGPSRDSFQMKRREKLALFALLRLEATATPIAAVISKDAAVVSPRAVSVSRSRMIVPAPRNAIHVARASIMRTGSPCRALLGSPAGEPAVRCWPS
jgi:hypothetical protein